MSHEKSPKTSRHSLVSKLEFRPIAGKSRYFDVYIDDVLFPHYTALKPVRVDAVHDGSGMNVVYLPVLVDGPVNVQDINDAIRQRW